MEDFETQKHENDDSPKKFCENCGKELDINEMICSNCGYSFEHPNFKEEDLSTKVKNFILKVGRFLVDFDTIFGIFIAILVFLLLILAMFGCFIPDESGYFEMIKGAPIAFALAIIIPIIILFFVVIWHYIIYLLIDIKDSLKNIENNTQGK